MIGIRPDRGVPSALPNRLTAFVGYSGTSGPPRFFKPALKWEWVQQSHHPFCSRSLGNENWGTESPPTWPGSPDQPISFPFADNSLHLVPPSSVLRVRELRVKVPVQLRTSPYPKFSSVTASVISFLCVWLRLTEIPTLLVNSFFCLFQQS